MKRISISRMIVLNESYPHKNSLKFFSLTFTTAGSKPWSCLIKVLSDKDGDEEVTCFCLTLINKVRISLLIHPLFNCAENARESCCNVFFLYQILNAAPDQDLFYDISDSLEEQGIEQLLKVILKKLQFGFFHASLLLFIMFYNFYFSSAISLFS
jgi:hypothetical protein